MSRWSARARAHRRLSPFLRYLMTECILRCQLAGFDAAMEDVKAGDIDPLSGEQILSRHRSRDSERKSSRLLPIWGFLDLRFFQHWTLTSPMSQ